MNQISALRGMRYPDEYLVRMFYKEGLSRLPGRALELGCGSANNMMLFAAYGWSVSGIDVDPTCLSEGRHNLSISGMSGEVLLHDLSLGLPALQGPFNALLAPSTLYYLSRDATWDCMRQASSLLAPGAAVYLRMRLPDDHRAGRGESVGKNAWKLECTYTGEQGALNVFWQEYELIELLRIALGMDPERLTTLKTTYENLQNGHMVRNSDIVIWGRTP